MIAVAYVANVIYRYVLSHTSTRFKYISSVLLVVFAGWISSCFGFNFSETVIFNLRFIPLIIATLVYPRSYTLIIIGVAIGLTSFIFISKLQQHMIFEAFQQANGGPGKHLFTVSAHVSIRE